MLNRRSLASTSSPPSDEPDRATRLALVVDRAAAAQKAASTELSLAALLPFAAILVGVLVRLAPIIGAGFPLNDGGLFYRMVEDIRDAGFALPSYASYNGGDIPFAYPPLPFYLTAALSSATGLETLTLLRVLPLLFCVLTLGAVYLLARSVLASERAAGVAMLVFAVIPRAYNWELAGGGLTRSPGLLFATLAIWQAYELFVLRRRRALPPTMVFAALTALCHIEMVYFVAFTCALFLFWEGATREKLRDGAILAAGVLLLTSPWWALLLTRFGVEPLIAAFASGGYSIVSPLRLLLLNSTEEVGFPIALILALLGLLASMRDRRYLLPVWLVLIFVLDPRKADTLSTIPIALLASIGLMEVVWPLLRQATNERYRSGAAWVIGGLLLIYAPIAAILSAGDSQSPLYALPESNRDAMSWVRENTPVEARFLVVPSSRAWRVDGPQEWFPALAERRSITTVQGSEWLAGGQFGRLAEANREMTKCGVVACVEVAAADLGEAYEYVYVSKGESPLAKGPGSSARVDCCAALRESFSADDRYTKVFENDGAVVYARKDASR